MQIKLRVDNERFPRLAVELFRLCRPELLLGVAVTLRILREMLRCSGCCGVAESW
jgi:hypothetical protein